MLLLVSSLFARITDIPLAVEFSFAGDLGHSKGWFHIALELTGFCFVSFVCIFHIICWDVTLEIKLLDVIGIIPPQLSSSIGPCICECSQKHIASPTKIHSVFRAREMIVFSCFFFSVFTSIITDCTLAGYSVPHSVLCCKSTIWN